MQNGYLLISISQSRGYYESQKGKIYQIQTCFPNDQAAEYGNRIKSDG